MLDHTLFWEATYTGIAAVDDGALTAAACKALAEPRCRRRCTFVGDSIFYQAPGFELS